MSKVSAMQAMREARYAAARTSRPAATAAPVAPIRRPSTQPLDDESPQPPDALDPAVAAEMLTPAFVSPSVDGAVQADDATPAEALCGHRSMNNRSCRRPAGHPEKNHRYN